MSIVPNGYKQTDVGVIPDDWIVIELKDCCSKITDGTHDTPKPVSSGFPFLTAIHVKENDIAFHDCYYLPKNVHEIIYKRCNPENGDVLMVNIGAGVATTALVNVDYEFSLKNVALLKPNISELNGSFLNYFLIKNKPTITSSVLNGGAQPFLSLNQISKLTIALPPTKAEQTAIATALNDADSLIRSLETLIAKKRAIKQGAMQELLKPKDGWEMKMLGDVAILKARIGWQGLTTAEYRTTGEYYLITGTEFKNGFIDWNNCVYVDEKRYRQDRNIQIKEHDVLITKDGTIGKVALIKSVPKPATLNSGVFVIRPIDNAFHPEFFYYLLLSDVFIKFLSQLSAGSTINHLYQKDFVSFSFETPKLIEEQIKIAQILADMDTEIEALERKLEKYKKIKQGMMQNLLTGRIRLV